VTTKLPTGWVETTIDDVCLPILKTDPARSRSGSFKYIDIGSINSATLAVETPQSVSAKNAPSRARQIVAAKDILFSTVRPYLRGIAAVPDELDGEIASTGFSVLRTSNAVNPSFLFYWVTSNNFINRLLPLQRGSSYPAVRDEDVRGMQISVPPLREQARIVAAIDELFVRLDAADLDLQSSTARASRFLESVLFEEFGLQNFSAGQSETGSALSDIFKIGTGATPLRSESRYYDSGTIPWITSSSVNSSTIESADQYITEAAIKETNCKVFPPGTLIVAMYGEGKTRGKVSRLAIPAATNQACAALVPEIDDPLKIEYCLRFLEAGYEAMRRVASGGVQPNLNLGFFKGLRIKFPARNHIKGFLENAEEAERTRDLALELLMAAQERSSSLRQSILAAAYRGELVPQDPEDEPASVLLDRIRAQRAATAAAPTARKTGPTASAKRKRA
jgi:type I restriction enzyme S subunit